MADKRQKPNRDLLDRIADDFSDQPEVAMGTMFGSPGLRVGGKVFAFLGFDGELIVKVPRERVRELVDAGTAEQVTMGKRTMREWVEVPARRDREATLALWGALAREAHDHVDSLRQPT
jgi:TfoX/Sxy family transcriptional regulator of competence genes